MLDETIGLDCFEEDVGTGKACEVDDRTDIVEEPWLEGDRGELSLQVPKPG
jgi:hypothetical protein